MTSRSSFILWVVVLIQAVSLFLTRQEYNKLKSKYESMKEFIVVSAKSGNNPYCTNDTTSVSGAEVINMCNDLRLDYPRPEIKYLGINSQTKGRKFAIKGIDKRPVCLRFNKMGDFVTSNSTFKVNCRTSEQCAFIDHLFNNKTTRTTAEDYEVKYILRHMIRECCKKDEFNTRIDERPLPCRWEIVNTVTNMMHCKNLQDITYTVRVDWASEANVDKINPSGINLHNDTDYSK